MPRFNIPKRERSKDEIPFSEMTPAQKRSYLWDYWKTPVLVTIIVVAVLASIIYSVTHSVDPRLFVTLINCPEEGSFDSYVDAYAQSHQIAQEELAVVDMFYAESDSAFGADAQENMALFVRMQAGDEDVLIMPEDIFNDIGASSYFMDLREVLPEEWQDKILVVEQRYDEIEEIQPEPIACGIRVRDIPGMPDTPYYRDAVIAISYFPAHPEDAEGFLLSLL